MVAFFNEGTGMNLTPVFDQYLRHKDIPALELKRDDAQHTISYRWVVDEPAFAMPIRIALNDHWQLVIPTTQWQRLPAAREKDGIRVASDLYYVNVVED
jgi:hypothetical protein